MNETLKTILAEAMHLGREGRFTEATALIQRGLHLTQPLPEQRESHPSAGDPDRRPVVEADFEVIEDIGRTGGRSIHGHFTHGIEARDYRVYVPAGADDRPRPLILMLHGCQQDAEDFARLTRLDPLADELGFIVLYPTQSRTANATGCWNWFLPEHRRADQGEAAWLIALTRAIATRYQADPHHIHVAGLSAGGAMALTLAATQPALFRSVGVHSGLPHGLAQDQLSALTLMHQGPTAVSGGRAAMDGISVPVIVFQGDADLRVNPANASGIIEQALSGAPEARSGLDALGVERETGRAPGGLGYTRTRYPAADGSIRAELWMVQGGGHAWFGGDPAASFAEPRGPDASREMVRFFLEHSAP